MSTLLRVLRIFGLGAVAFVAWTWSIGSSGPGPYVAALIVALLLALRGFDQPREWPLGDTTDIPPEVTGFCEQYDACFGAYLRPDGARWWRKGVVGLTGVELVWRTAGRFRPQRERVDWANVRGFDWRPASWWEDRPGLDRSGIVATLDHAGGRLELKVLGRLRPVLQAWVDGDLVP